MSVSRSLNLLGQWLELKKNTIFLETKKLTKNSSAGDNHRMEFGLFDDDFQDNGEVDRNVDEGFDDNDNLVEENERGYSNKGMSKLEAKCRKQTKDLFYGNLLSDCKKVKGWQKRIDHLLDDLTRMKKTCLKQEY